MPKGVRIKSKEHCSPPSSTRVKWEPTAAAHRPRTPRGVQDERQDEALSVLGKQALRQSDGYLWRNFNNPRFLPLCRQELKKWKSTKITILRYLFFVISSHLLPRCMLDCVNFLAKKKKNPHKLVSPLPLWDSFFTAEWLSPEL